MKSTQLIESIQVSEILDRAGLLENDSTQNNYNKSYYHFVKYFEAKQQLTEHDLVIAANFTYGWMPTILKFKSDGFVAAVTIINKARGPHRISDEELETLKKLMNNSICSMVLNQQLHAFLPTSKISNFYLAYALKTQENYFYSAATKTALPYLNKDNCNATPIALLPLKEQTAIANALSDVDNLIAALETLINKKTAIKTATMQQLLTGKKRLPGFAKQNTNTEQTAQTTQALQTDQNSDAANSNNSQTATRLGYKHTELGETNSSGTNLDASIGGPQGGGMDSRRIPEDWEIRSLNSLCTIMTGSTPATNNPAYYGEEFMFASPADFKGQKYVTNTIKKLSTKGFNISRKYPKNSVLFTCIGSTIGKCGVATQEMTSNQQINAVLPSDEIEENYLYYQLVYTAPQVKQQAGKQAVPLVNKTQFGEHTA